MQAIAIAGYRGENFHMVANQKIIAAINEQIGNEFSAMLQYYAISAHFGAEALLELSAHFHKQAEEEKQHALRFIQFVIDVGARVDIASLHPVRHRRRSACGHSGCARSTGGLQSRRSRSKAFARTGGAGHDSDQRATIHGKGRVGLHYRQFPSVVC